MRVCSSAMSSSDSRPRYGALFLGKQLAIIAVIMRGVTAGDAPSSGTVYVGDEIEGSTSTFVSEDEISRSGLPLS